MVELLRGGIRHLFKQNGVDLFEGSGRLNGPGLVEVNAKDELKQVRTRKVVLATGSRPARPGIFTGDIPGVITTDEILEMSSAPSSLLILGGGAVGVEIAAILAELGSAVTLLEMEKRILPGEDAEMAEHLQSLLKRRKVKVLTGAKVVKVEGVPGVLATLEDGRTLEADRLLLAAGRSANIKGIGLESAGLDVAVGTIKVNDHMQTATPGVYAAGDVTGGMWLAHVAFAEGITAAEHAMGMNSGIDYRVVPRCIFSFPEYAAVGMTEEEARADHLVTSVSFPFKSLGMAQAVGEWEGMAKLVVESKTEKILGRHIIGPHASDLIAEVPWPCGTTSESGA